MNPVFFFILLVILSVAFILTIKFVFSQDKKSEETLKKTEKDLKAAQEEIAKLTSELSLKTQMFEGLKGQYNELEKDYEKLAHKAQETPKPKPVASAQAITPPPQAMPSIKTEPQQPEPQKPETQKPEAQKSEPDTT